jgi:TM2 domain-containing membrane protein YozV
LTLPFLSFSGTGILVWCVAIGYFIYASIMRCVLAQPIPEAITHGTPQPYPSRQPCFSEIDSCISS